MNRDERAIQLLAIFEEEVRRILDDPSLSPQDKLNALTINVGELDDARRQFDQRRPSTFMSLKRETPCPDCYGTGRAWNRYEGRACPCTLCGGRGVIACGMPKQPLIKDEAR